MPLHCPKCHSKLSHTINTKTTEWRMPTTTGLRKVQIVRRRRKCLHCKTSYWCQEILEEDILTKEVNEQKRKQALEGLIDDLPPDLPPDMPPNPYL